jgi:hypothetical protein
VASAPQQDDFADWSQQEVCFSVEQHDGVSCRAAVCTGPLSGPGDRKSVVVIVATPRSIRSDLSSDGDLRRWTHGERQMHQQQRDRASRVVR